MSSVDKLVREVLVEPLPGHGASQQTFGNDGGCGAPGLGQVDER
ncbi:hypothetical protein M892_08990 [Vibrio campbellii ATCC BAA-1116]|uniref:Uncharacterized protein n=1 Tax=Vibrio campbellii (strain ATCC BAA-1116) TaxID=2902295 RepID=A7N0G7_VIBC1|nr:hypothetical protein VIBHAR_00775 [Vibrio campbellii ATCC BAA-1116]AGU96569.1 hypothetical protein M892_08990 [Vibrio campbellii ATCC BAA-1116]